MANDILEPRDFFYTRPPIPGAYRRAKARLEDGTLLVLEEEGPRVGIVSRGEPKYVVSLHEETAFPVSCTCKGYRKHQARGLYLCVHMAATDLAVLGGMYLDTLVTEKPQVVFGEWASDAKARKALAYVFPAGPYKSATVGRVLALDPVYLRRVATKGKAQTRDGQRLINAVRFVLKKAQVAQASQAQDAPEGWQVHGEKSAQPQTQPQVSSPPVDDLAALAAQVQALQKQLAAIAAALNSAQSRQ